MCGIAGFPLRIPVRFHVVLAFLFAALVLTLSPPFAHADTQWPGGWINVDTIWTEAGSPHIVNGTVIVASGVTLTIEPGVTVRMCSGCSLYINGNGTLNAVGTAAKPILFISQAGTPAKGDWGMIYLYDTAHARLSYSTVAYGGGGSSDGGLVSWSSDVTLRDSTVRDSKGYGIYLGGSGKTPTLERVTFENNASAAIRFENPGNKPVLHDLVATGNGRDGIELSGWLAADGILDGAAAKLPYVVTGEMVADASRTMTVTAGTTVQFTGGGDFRVYGTLIAEGTAAQPILWTSAAGTPAKGDWDAIYLLDTAHARLFYSTMAYGGSKSGADLIIWSSDVTLRDSTVRDSKGYGIYLRGSGRMPTIERVSLENNGEAAIWFENPGNKPVLHDLIATGNGRNGIELSGWLAADGIMDGGGAKIPYIVDGQLLVGAGRALTITAGTTVQFTPDATMQVDGKLEAQGTAAQPIVFTSLAAAPAPGDWREIWLKAGSVARLAHCEVAYGGSGNNASLMIASTDAAVTDCTVRDGKAHGVLLRGAGIRPVLDRVSLLRNAWAALRLEDPGQSPVMISLQASGNGTDAVSVGGGMMGTSATWDASRALLPIQVESAVQVPSGRFLSLAAGTTVRFGPDGYFQVYGNLYAVGTASQAVLLTGTTMAPGAWSGVNVQSGGYAILYGVELWYGGRNTNPMLYVAGNAVVTYSRLSGSSSDGIQVNNARPILAGNRIEGNAFGVRNNTPATSVDARGNWWGDASGPHHASNPAGQGNAVSDGVLFNPWLTAPPAGGAAVGGGLVLSLGGPRRVSPGGTADYAMFYLNATTRTLTSAVVVLALPDSTEFVEATQGGIHWPELGQVFWRLGDLQPGMLGVLTARVRYDWGLPLGLVRPAAAFLLGDGLSSGGLDVTPYQAYTPSGPVSSTPLTPAEVAALLGANPDLNTIFQQSVSSGMIHGTSERLTYADNSSVVSLGLVAPATGRATFLTADANAVAAASFGPDEYAVRAAAGGMTTTLSTAQWDFWGTFDQPALAAQTQDAPAGIDRLPGHPYTACVSNCLLWKAPSGALNVAFSEISSVVKVLMNARTCLDAVTQHSADAAAKCLNAIKYKLPLFGNALKAVHCVSDCVTPVNWIRYKCTPGETTEVCGTGGTIMGWIYDKAGGAPYMQYKCDDNGIWTEAWPQICGKGYKCVDSVAGDLGYALCVKTQSCPAVGSGQAGLVASAAGSTTQADICTEMFTAHDPNAKYGPVGDLLPSKPVTYTVEWENVGQGTAYGVYVTDKLSDLFDDTTLDLQGSGEYLASARTILWDVGELAPKGQPGSTGQVTFTVTPRAGLPGGTVLTNQADVYFPSVSERTPTNVVVNVLAPITALPLEVETNAGQPVLIALRGADPAGAALTFAVAEQPLYGTLAGGPPAVTYAPIAGFNGQDRFTYTASNAITTSRPAEVTILVKPSSAADTQPPQVRWTSPANGAADVDARPVVLYTDGTGPVYAPALAVAFDEPMDAASLASALRLQAPSGALIPLAVLWDGSANRALAAPRQPLVGGALYTGRVTTAAHDTAGNPLAAAYAWTFRTARSPVTYLPLVLKK